MSPPGAQSRPGGGGSDTESLAGGSGVPILTQPPELTPLARLLIGRVPDRRSIPRYASEAWAALPDQDARRAASIMVAASAWVQHCSPWQVAQDLAAEMRERDLELARRVREASWDISRDWSFTGETHAELVRRRVDYDGGSWARERMAS
jgi:hypothetical protein